MKFYYDSKKKKAEDKISKSLKKLENSKRANKRKKAIGNNEEKKIDEFQKKSMLALKASKNEKMSPETKGTLISAAITVGLGLITFLIARSEYKYQESVYNYKKSLSNAARGGGGVPDQSARLRRLERENARLRAEGSAFTGRQSQTEAINNAVNSAVNRTIERLNEQREREDQERRRREREEENRRNLNSMSNEVRETVSGLRELSTAVKNEATQNRFSGLDIDPSPSTDPHHNAFENTPPRQLDLDSGYLLDECISRVVKDYGVKGMKKGEHVMEGKHVKEEPNKPRRHNTSQNSYNTLNAIKKTALGLGAASLGILGGSLAARALKARKAANSLNKSAKEIQSSWDRVNETNRRKQEALKQFENKQRQGNQNNYNLSDVHELQRELLSGKDLKFNV